jgi:hypothetical protein
VGKTPDEKDLLQMYVKGELIVGALVFKILTKISSYPLEFLGFSDLITFSISVLDVGLNLISGKGVRKACNK